MRTELDTVVVTRDLPQSRLRRGDVGIVVLVHKDGAAYEVEFATLGGDTLAVVTLLADAILTATTRDIPHAREMA